MADGIPSRKQRRQAPGARLHNDKLHAQAQERRGRALALRLRGMSIALIAKQIGIDEKTAYKYVKDALAAIPRDTAKEEIALAIASREDQKLAQAQRRARVLERLGDESLTAHEYARLHAVLTGIDSLILDIDQDLAKLKGQYAPQQHTVSVLERVNPATVREMTDEQLHRIAAGDLTVLTNGARDHRTRDGGAGDPPPTGTA